MNNKITESDYLYTIFPDRPFELAPDEREDHQWSNIHFLFGQTTLRSQAYEDGMARFIVAAEEQWYRSGKTAEEIWRMTLGPLQKEYARYCLLEKCHYERMENALKVRNSLAHNFYRRRMQLLESPEGREQIIRELHEAAELFQQERDDVYWNLSMLTGQPLL